MCELFGFSGRHEANLIPYLLEFFSHGGDNPHGWGLADRKSDGQFQITREAVRADHSRQLPHVIKDLRPTRLLLAHTRNATVGDMTVENCHPFCFSDDTGCQWLLMHNGTIFQSDRLGRYQRQQHGTTDSERIVLCLVDQMNRVIQEDGALTEEQRRSIVERLVRELSPNNKLNLILSDGTFLYVHINTRGSLYRKDEGEGVLFSSKPLDGEHWSPVEINRLLVYRDGEQVYEGPAHSFENNIDVRASLPPDFDTYTGSSDLRDYRLDRAIWHKYIIPTQRTPGPYVGVELEYPIVHMGRQPVDFDVVHELSRAFVEKFGLDHQKLDDDSFIYNAYSSQNGDDLSFDCSYNTLELSFGKEEDINVLYDRFCEYYRFIQDFLLPRGHSLTGMGVNPNWDVNNNIPVASERYRMLLHHLESYPKYRGDFHSHPNFGLFSCASQVQIDVGYDRIAPVLNTFNRLEPLKSVLFANSWWPETGQLCSRDDFWARSMHGLNRKNVGEYEAEFRDVGEVIEYIKSMSIYSMERAGKYINFAPIPLRDYFASRFMSGEFFDGIRYRPISFTPALEDLQFLRSFKFEDLTFRGTVEFRSVCEQPVRDVMCVAAFHAGLMQRVEALNALLRSDLSVYGLGLSPVELRAALNLAEWPSVIDRSALSALLLRVLDLAAEGLAERGFGEERFLEPLYSRARTLVSPAAAMKAALEQGTSRDELITAYAAL
ncbi:MAG: class II glutamine amidotransferase [Oscillospiraceae bacterium]|nr:class II glutamine amidotransferase [Oscillospiraceae bacterium]